MASFLSSGDLARQAGVSVDTLRHYERKRVWPPPERRSNSYREWPVETREKLADVEARIAELNDLREQLRFVIGDWDQRLAAAGLGRPAHLLESLHEVEIAPHTKQRRKE